MAQTVPGTLSDTVSSTTTTKNQGGGVCTTVNSNYTWTFKDPSGVAHTFPGTSQQISSTFEGGNVRRQSGIHPDDGGCNLLENFPLDVWSTDGLYYLAAEGPNGTVTLAGGYINPKYVVVGVTYAPPGGNNQSYVSYMNTNLVGNTSNVTNSFTSNTTVSVSVSGTTGGISIGGGLLGFSGGVTVTGSESDAWTEGSNSANTITISKSNALTFKTPGVPNVYSPVDHDYDIIWLWLNPVAHFGVPPTNKGTAGDSVIWTGYGYDYNDPLHEIDIWPVYVGYLNGHFGALDPQDAGVFARSWVKTQTFPSGQGPGITSADYPAILGADPFATNPGYLVSLKSGTNPPTTTDERFTMSEFNNTTPQSVAYKQAPLNSTTGQSETYTDQYSTSDAQSQGGSYKYEQTFGLEEKVGGSFFWQSVSFDFKQSQSFTWENTWQNTVTNSSTEVDTAQITGPPCPATAAPCNPQYTEPHEFAIYQDNLYGTFMFWPNPYFSIGTVTPATQTIKAGASASFSLPTAANAGYTGTLTSLTVAGLPSGASASFTPTTGKAGITFAMKVSTTSATAAGTYPLTISANDGSQSYYAYVTLAVTATPGFTLIATPATQTIGMSSAASYTLTTTATNGFNSVVDLYVAGLPSNSSASFSPESITGSGTSTLTITTTANTAPGTYLLTFTATGGGVTQTTTGTLVVTGTNFTLTVAPEAQAINAGTKASYTVSTAVLSGFSGNVALTVSGLPSGATASFSPTSITGAGSSTLTITTSTGTPAGDYNLGVTGTSGKLQQTASIQLEVNN